MTSDCDTYLTVEESVKGEYKEKGSKFISFLYPVCDVDQVKDIVKSVGDEYFDARHVCWAYRIGQDGQLWRAVDDGEPSGTAGRPILGQLLSANITNVLAVVVRYFGGTKLGVGGLINAYKTAVEDAVKNASVIQKTVDITLSVKFDFEKTDSVMKAIRRHDAKIVQQLYDNNSVINLVVRLANKELLIDELQKIDKLLILEL